MKKKIQIFYNRNPNLIVISLKNVWKSVALSFPFHMVLLLKKISLRFLLHLSYKWFSLIRIQCKQGFFFQSYRGNDSISQHWNPWQLSGGEKKKQDYLKKREKRGSNSKSGQRWQENQDRQLYKIILDLCQRCGM